MEEKIIQSLKTKIYEKKCTHFLNCFNVSDKTFCTGAIPGSSICLLYTSDAADERSSVDLGGRRIINKKKKEKKTKKHKKKKKNTKIE